MGKFDGKYVLITGAARGIGQATALKFASEGANLLLADLKEEWLEETKTKAEALGSSVSTFSVDVQDSEAVKKAVDAALAVNGTIDVLVNNAGITKDGLIVRMSDEDWDAVIGVNLKGVFLFSRAISKIMMKQRSGSVINVASVIGLIGNAGQSNYAASKAGVIAITRSMAKEVAKRGVRVNAVAPGYIQTKMTEALSDDVRDMMLNVIPMNKFGEPKHVADAIAFLASDEAEYITGQVLTVCGGMVTC